MSDGLLVLGEGLYELGLEPRSGQVREGIGGDAANAAVMAATMGAPTELVGRVGDDELGRRLTAFWSSRGVDVSRVSVDAERPTGIYVNALDDDGVHCFDYHRYGSAGSRLEPADVPDVGGRWVHTTGIGLAVSASSADACRAAAAAAGRSSFAVNFRPRLAPDVDALRAATASADVVFLSDEDAGHLYGGVDAALTALRASEAEVVLSLGAAGARVVAADGEHLCAPPPVDVVDAAGAGDALAGAYLAARLHGAVPVDALASGVAAAALSCRSRGCALSYPTAGEVVAVAAALSVTPDRGGTRR